MSGKYGHSVFTLIFYSYWYNFLDCFSKTYIFRWNKAMGMQVEDQLWYVKTRKSTVPNLHSHYRCGASGQQNCAICTKYLKDSMPGHQNLSQVSNHVPQCIKRQGARIKKNAPIASQNNLCINSIHCPYLP